MMKPLLATLAVLAALLARSADTPTIKVGILEHDAEKYNVEFRQYNPLAKTLAADGILAALAPSEGLGRQPWPEDKIYATLCQYDVVVLNPHPEGFYRLTDEYREQAKRAGSALARYVRAGGGLYLGLRGVRYAGDADEKYWNLVVEPLGVQILHEGTYDPTRTFTTHRGRATDKVPYWTTANVAEHPVTAGVRNLTLPTYDFGQWAGLPACQYNADWTVIVRGEQEARSVQASPVDNKLDLTKVGTYPSAPPVVAVRQLGKGRIVSYPLTPIHWRLNWENPLWPHTVETVGNPATGIKSDSQKLIVNALKWLAEPALEVADIGTYEPEEYARIVYPPRVDWSETRFPDPVPEPLRGITGCVSSYAGGTGTVAEYAAAAQAAGLSFIVFSDPLEKLTPATLDQLKADCKAVSTAGFYACPGVEFTNGIGVRWATWGERIIFPETEKRRSANEPAFTLWDGERVLHRGWYAADLARPGAGIVDHDQMRAAKAPPENLWWFYHYFPLVYDNGKQVADNVADYLAGLANMRWCALFSRTRITDPGQVAQAAATCWTTIKDMESVEKCLNTRGAPYWNAAAGQQTVTQGPVVAQWAAINSQMEENWRYTRGAQRVRLQFDVRSPAGIREVIVHDADKGACRRFAGHGEPQLVRTFETVHAKQHWLALEVVDMEGKRAFSWYIFVYAYKRGLFRCGDNLNILGPTGMIWHPDRAQMFPMAKPFANGEDYSIQGWDRGGPMCPMPEAGSFEILNVKGRGWYPDRYQDHRVVGNIQKVILGSYNMQIARKTMDFLNPCYGQEGRPPPSMASCPTMIADHEYFTRVHTLYAFADRKDMYTTWNHRRRREGHEHYRGGLLWHEGEIRFKQDVTLDGDVPIPLADIRMPIDVSRGWGTTWVTTDADGTTKVQTWDGTEERNTVAGHVRPGGYVAPMPSLVGYLAFLAPYDTDFTYRSDLPHWVRIGLGERDQTIAEGTVLKYRFGFATLADARDGNRLAEYHARALNLDGGRHGYPFTVKVGKCTDATVFFTVAAAGNEAVFDVGPVRDLVVDLPIRVTGLAATDTAAVYSNGRKWFRFVPVVDGTAYFQEQVDGARSLWVGNVFVADNPAVTVTLVQDGQAPDAPAFLQLHNPTDKPLTVQVTSPPNTPVFGGAKLPPAQVPAGDSVTIEL